MEQKDMFYDEASLMREEAARKMMVGVYGWMSLALMITAITALGVATSTFAYYAMGFYPVFIIAELILVIYLSARVNKMNTTVARFWFIVYAVLNGITLSFIFGAYSLGSIGYAFIVTAGLFAVMTLYGYITKSDLTGIGNLFVMALFGMLIASVANIFFKNEGISLALTYIGVFVFVGLIGYDTQKIKNLAYSQNAAGNSVQNASIMGALVLYLDFINLFLRILRLLGKRD